MDIGVGVLPKLPRDAGDRNRTSPFAFTGNKFEFRAVSSNQGIAMPNIALNVAVTESLDYCATELEKQPEGRQEARGSGQACCSARWSRRASGSSSTATTTRPSGRRKRRKRGLLNLRTSVDAFGESLKPDVVKAFEQYGVLNARELHARHEVALEQYNKTINIEAQLMVLMANRSILPAAYRFQGELAQTVVGGQGRRRHREGVAQGARRGDAADRRVPDTSARRSRSCSSTRRTATLMKHAKFFRDKVVPAMASLREAGDGARGHGAAGHLAAADLPRDAVRQVAVRHPDRLAASRYAGRLAPAGRPLLSSREIATKA